MNPTQNPGEPPGEAVNWAVSKPWVSVIPSPGFVSVASNAAGTYAVLTQVGDGNLEWVGTTADGTQVNGLLSLADGTFCPDWATIDPGPGDEFRVAYIGMTVDGCGSNSNETVALLDVTVSQAGNLSRKAGTAGLMSGAGFTQTDFIDLATDAEGNAFIFANGFGAASSLQGVYEPDGVVNVDSVTISAQAPVAIDVARTGDPPAAVGGVIDDTPNPRYYARGSPGSWAETTMAVPEVLFGERPGVAVWDADNYAVAYPQGDGASRAIKVDVAKGEGEFPGRTIVSEDVNGAYQYLKLIAPGTTADGDAVYYAFWSEEGADYKIQFAVSTDGGETWDPPVQVNDEPMAYVESLDAAYNPETREIHVWWLGAAVDAGITETVFSSVGREPAD